MTQPARALPPEDHLALPAGGSGPNGPGTRPSRPGAPGLVLVPPLKAPRPPAPARRPVHVVVAVGMTAGLYAVSLAGVTSLQSAADAQLAADRAPAEGVVAQLKSTHDAMEDSLARFASAYTRAANGYQAIAKGIAGHEQALASLGHQVQAAAGSAAALSVPTITLPTFSAPTLAGGGRPASGASGSAAGGGVRPRTAASAPSVSAPGVSTPNVSAPGVSAASVPAPVLAPLPVVSNSAPVVNTPPVVNACTTASGKPC